MLIRLRSKQPFSLPLDRKDVNFDPLARDLGEAVGSKVDRRSSPHNFYNLSKHQVVARMEAHQGRIESQPHARARTIKK